MSRLEYDQMIAAGAFGPEDRFELLEGFLVTTGPPELQADSPMVDAMASVEIPRDVPDLLHPMSRHQYDRLVEIGEFGPEDRFELLEGYLITMSPHDPRHSNVIIVLTELLARALPPGLQLLVQLPIAATDGSQPEPDLAVVTRGDYRREHPKTALLVIEVANTSHRIDLGPKAQIYAAAGVVEYWVIDVVANVVHRHLGPAAGGYGESTEHTTGRLRSTAVPEFEVDLDDLLAP